VRARIEPGFLSARVVVMVVTAARGHGVQPNAVTKKIRLQQDCRRQIGKHVGKAIEM